MGTRPYVDFIAGPGSSGQAANLVREIAALYQSLPQDLRIDEDDDMALLRAWLDRWPSDDALESLRLLFEHLCRVTDWHVQIDWDGLDDSFPDEFDSLDRPPGVEVPRPLWP